jgi:hypothetical protein
VCADLTRFVGLLWLAAGGLRGLVRVLPPVLMLLLLVLAVLGLGVS